jgi:glucose/mannose-6-phosphate isomerase
MSEVNLDDLGAVKVLDPDDMLRRIDDLSGQIETAWELVSDLSLPSDYADVENVVIVGMGGSAIGGSLVQAYALASCPVPVTVWRKYGIPGFVGPRSLVIAVSVSGNTEETLSAFQSAREAGARLFAISTGGELSHLAAKWTIPSFQFQYDALPRATIGYLLIPLLRIFEVLRFIKPQEAFVKGAIEVARQAREDWSANSPESGNEAKQLARRLVGRSAVVYGADHLAPVARRWKTQLNENSKIWAAFEEFPELNHNAVVGYEYPTQMRDRVLVLLLAGPLVPQRILTRISVTERLMEQYGIQWQTITTRGADRLSEMVSAVALGDYVSYYVALLNNTDPTTIEPINILKAALAAQ